MYLLRSHHHSHTPLPPVRRVASSWSGAWTRALACDFGIEMGIEQDKGIELQRYLSLKTIKRLCYLLARDR